MIYDNFICFNYFLNGCVVDIEVVGLVEGEVVENKIKIDLWKLEF